MPYWWNIRLSLTLTANPIIVSKYAANLVFKQMHINYFTHGNAIVNYTIRCVFACGNTLQSERQYDKMCQCRVYIRVFYVATFTTTFSHPLLGLTLRWCLGVILQRIPVQQFMSSRRRLFCQSLGLSIFCTVIQLLFKWQFVSAVVAKWSSVKSSTLDR